MKTRCFKTAGLVTFSFWGVWCLVAYACDTDLSYLNSKWAHYPTPRFAMSGPPLADDDIKNEWQKRGEELGYFPDWNQDLEQIKASLYNKKVDDVINEYKRQGITRYSDMVKDLLAKKKAAQQYCDSNVRTELTTNNEIAAGQSRASAIVKDQPLDSISDLEMFFILGHWYRDYCREMAIQIACTAASGATQGQSSQPPPPAAVPSTPDQSPSNSSSASSTFDQSSSSQSSSAASASSTQDQSQPTHTDQSNTTTPSVQTDTSTEEQLPPSHPSTNYPMGILIPGKDGFIKSPYAEFSEAIDIRTYPPGTAVRCPFTNKIFIVPNAGQIVKTRSDTSTGTGTDADIPVAPIAHSSVPPEEQANQVQRNGAESESDGSENDKAAVKSSPIDDNTPLDELERRANSGEAPAQAYLGYRYAHGNGVSIDYSRSLSWLQKAADQGDAAGQNGLGNAYYYGRGVKVDYQQALSWFQKSAEQGNCDAQNSIGYMYETGDNGVSQDYKQAVTWFQKAADQGDAAGQSNLAMMYKKGWGVDVDYQQALSWFQKSAEQGNARAEAQLGTMYYAGSGVTKDISTAESWFRKSAAQGDPEGAKWLKYIRDSHDSPSRFSADSSAPSDPSSAENATQNSGQDDSGPDLDTTIKYIIAKLYSLQIYVVEPVNMDTDALGMVRLHYEDFQPAFVSRDASIDLPCQWWMAGGVPDHGITSGSLSIFPEKLYDADLSFTQNGKEGIFFTDPHDHSNLLALFDSDDRQEVLERLARAIRHAGKLIHDSHVNEPDIFK